MKKTLLALMLAVCAGFVVAGCTGGGEDPVAENPTGGQPIKEAVGMSQDGGGGAGGGDNTQMTKGQPK